MKNELSNEVLENVAGGYNHEKYMDIIAGIRDENVNKDKNDYMSSIGKKGQNFDTYVNSLSYEEKMSFMHDFLKYVTGNKNIKGPNVSLFNDMMNELSKVL